MADMPCQGREVVQWCYPGGGGQAGDDRPTGDEHTAGDK